MASFDCIYLKDSLAAVIPGRHLALDVDLLGRHWPSYRFMSYLEAAAGPKVDPDLPGSDRPELVDVFYRDANVWLAG
ncbi:MAG: hypothetical protein M3N50_03850 [Pseudomonadota bacterium]|nr:hypothetical protein [Pseudomonadota bacterium]